MNKFSEKKSFVASSYFLNSKLNQPENMAHCKTKIQSTNMSR